MKMDKAALSLGISGAVSLALFAIASLTKSKHAKRDNAFEIDKDTEWVLDCLDEMIMDIKHSHKQQTEQEKRLARLEERIENVNGRLDNIVGGK